MRPYYLGLPAFWQVRNVSFGEGLKPRNQGEKTQPRRHAGLMMCHMEDEVQQSGVCFTWRTWPFRGILTNNLFWGAQQTGFGQWIFQVLVKGGRDYITPYKAIYTWYISGIFPANWVIIYYRSHPLQEPEKSIDLGVYKVGRLPVISSNWGEITPNK